MSKTSNIATSTDNASRFYERLVAEKLIASNWPANTELHNFGLECGEGASFRKPYFHIAAADIEHIVHLAIECGFDDELLDRYTTSSVAADAFPSRRQYGNVLGWNVIHGEVKQFPKQITLRKFLLGRGYMIPSADGTHYPFMKELLDRGVLIPHAVAEHELIRVNSARALEPKPFILEENVSQINGRRYGIKPKNAAGQPCDELTDAQKRKLYSSRFMHRFAIWPKVVIYVPAAPERVVEMISVLREQCVEGAVGCPEPDEEYPANEAKFLAQLLHSVTTSREAAMRFPCQDLFCLKWQFNNGKVDRHERKLISLGEWLRLQGYPTDETVQH